MPPMRRKPLTPNRIRRRPRPWWTILLWTTRRDEPATARDHRAPAETPATNGRPTDEGPRRRARREREERRAAQARAIAIENARREAKRNVAGRPSVEAKRPPRGLIRGLKALLWSALISVAAVGLGLLLYFTPIMAARVRGDHRSDDDQPGGGRAGRRGHARHAAAADRHRCRRRTGRDDPAGGHRQGAARVPVDVAHHDRRASPRRGQGLSGRPPPVRPGRRRLRHRHTAAGPALSRCRQPGSQRSAHEGGACRSCSRCARRWRDRSAASRRLRSRRSP